MPRLPLNPRKVVAGGLSLTAKGLQVGAFVARAVAERLGQDGTGAAGRSTRGDEGPGPVRVADTRLSPPPAADMRRGDVLQAPSAPVPMVDTHARTFETHAEELASRSAGDVINELPKLSTDDLRLLYEHEQANKKRKTVLQAIERQLTPVG